MPSPPASLSYWPLWLRALATVRRPQQDAKPKSARPLTIQNSLAFSYHSSSSVSPEAPPLCQLRPPSKRRLRIFSSPLSPASESSPRSAGRRPDARRALLSPSALSTSSPALRASGGSTDRNAPVPLPSSFAFGSLRGRRRRHAGLSVAACKEKAAEDAGSAGELPTAQKLEKRPQVAGRRTPCSITTNYENRLKFASAPEKVFEYYASLRDPKTGELFMTREDFFNSILPSAFEFPSSPASAAASDAAPVSFFSSSHALRRRGKDSGEASITRKDNKDFCVDLSFFGHPSSVLTAADANADGLISFEEFLFITALLATPLRLFRLAFDLKRRPPTLFAGYAEYTGRRESGEEAEKTENKGHARRHEGDGSQRREGHERRGSPTERPPGDEAGEELYLTKEEFVDLMETIIRRSVRGRKLVMSPSLSWSPSSSSRSPEMSASPPPDSAFFSLSLPESRTVHLKAGGGLRGCCEAFVAGPLGSLLLASSVEDDCARTDLKAEKTRRKETEARVISWSAFERFWEQLHAEIVLWDCRRAGPFLRRQADAAPALKAQDFAKLLVGFVDPSQMEGLSRRIHRLSFSNCEPVSLESVWAFDRICRQTEDLRLAIEFCAALESRGEDEKITPAALETALLALTSSTHEEKTSFRALVGVLFRVFNLDESGTLEKEEFLDMLAQRQEHHSAPSESRAFDVVHALQKKVFSAFKYR
ncbi:hypothetical protein BESB_078180 [Besnoitia besnoiti]|uniref:EF-hand domain-containing protein n=1 Tax=Besnoitia besnoiti TaxID=94643 RepID=A0A2A9MDY8_BESBE|nr:hypothetical protein BESB_078180 [Besnoitia besnoiti]PFH33602.1 hypothetical protein BESB_078180 [Besnoitia besnoiti]